jgi:hypothetical protein
MTVGLRGGGRRRRRYGAGAPPAGAGLDHRWAAAGSRGEEKVRAARSKAIGSPPTRVEKRLHLRLEDLF